MFTIVAERSIHQNGTKFYTLFMAQNLKTGAAVWINHWGPTKSMGIRVGEGCESQIHFDRGGVVEDDYKSKRRAKKGRGYSKWDMLVNEQNVSEIALRNCLKVNVDSRYFNDIFANLTSLSSTDKLEPQQMVPEVAAPAVPKKVNPLRGSW